MGTSFNQFYQILPLLENKMLIETSKMKIEMKINKLITNNSWIKENINHLDDNNYFLEYKLIKNERVD